MDNVEDVYSLTPMQEGLLYHTISEPSSGVYVDQVSCVLAGELNVSAFRGAWESTVKRHSSLRTCFLWDGLDEPLQIVREHVEIPWSEEDWRGLSSSDMNRRLAARLHEDCHRGFDLSSAPLMRMALFRWDTRTWRWIWTFHHLISDGWSTSIVLKEVFAAYSADPRNIESSSKSPFQYRDYIAWHAQQNLTTAEVFWRKELNDFTVPTRLHNCTRSVAVRSGLSDQQKRILDTDQTTALAALASTHRVTLNTVIQAAWSILLSRYSHDDDIVFGISMSGRPPMLAGIEEAVGLFINTLPLRPRISPETPLIDWMQALQKKQFEIREWEFVPLVAVQRWSQVPQGQALFETILVFENYPAAGELADERGIEIRDLEIFEKSNYPLAILIVPGERLELIAIYDTGGFDEDYVSRLLEHFVVLLRAFVEAPHRKLRDFSLLTVAERQQLLLAWNDTQTDFPKDLCVCDLIERVVEERPDALALVFETQTMTYRELDRRANRVAHGLRDLGVDAKVSVGLYTEPCIDMIVAILGILKAGGAYVPLDTRYPAEHIRFVAQDAELPVVLTQQVLIDLVPNIEARIVAIEALGGASEIPDEAPPVSGVEAENLAYVIYTSGSTGRPKGVMVTQRNLVHSTTARIDYYPGRVGRFLLLSSFAFDSSVAGIFWTLCTGGVLVIPARGVEQDMARLTALITDRQVTHLLCLPALYGLILENSHREQLTSLQLVMVAGEACPEKVIEQHFRRLPQTPLYNEYGPTEGTVWSTVYRVTETDGAGPVPIGHPIANTQVYLLDHHRQPVPVGVCGEIYLSGMGLARGYLNQPDLTTELFAAVTIDQQPSRRMYRTGDLAYYREDGCLVFLGRADAQVKIRGYRIELGGIEATLITHPAVADAAVILSKVSSGAQRERLTAYVAHHQGVGDPPDATTLDISIQNYLRDRLPKYMLPEQLIVMGTLPRLPNGKLDYKSLPQPGPVGFDRYGSTSSEPRTDAEKILAGIWVELLNLDSVGVEDNFFELGGDSIVSIQVISRARQAGLQIEPKHMASHPTIAALAQIAHSGRVTNHDQKIVSGDSPLTPIQAWFFELRMTAPHHWNQSALFEVPPDISEAALAAAFAKCWLHHDALRTRFSQVGDHWLQHFASPDEVRPPLTIVDLSRETDTQQASATHNVIIETQSSLDLTAGPLVRAVLIRRGPNKPSLVCIAIHHLVVDAVSWVILIEDLETVYGQAVSGKPAVLPAKTTSYRRWSHYLAQLPNTQAIRAELNYWTCPADHQDCSLWVDFTDRGVATEATAKTVTAELDPKYTDVLLTHAHEAYHTRVEELLVAALVLANHRCTGQAGLSLWIESHGRYEQFDGIDVSRTVGWFTSVYPLNLRLEAPPGDLNALIKVVKERLRSVPNRGLGYGILRYLNTDRRVVQTLERHAPAQLLFNYLSRVPHRSESAMFKRVSAVHPWARDPANIRPYQLEINAAINDGCLIMDVIYSETTHRADKVEAFARKIIESLHALCDHCVSPAAGDYTPSDFPDVELTQDELDRFLDGID